MGPELSPSGMQEQSVLMAKTLIGSAPPIRDFLNTVRVGNDNHFCNINTSSNDVGYLKLTKSQNRNGIAHTPSHKGKA